MTRARGQIISLEDTPYYHQKNQKGQTRLKNVNFNGVWFG